MSFREEFQELVGRHYKIRPLANDRLETMAAYCLLVLQWDGDGLEMTRYGIIEKMKRMERDSLRVPK